MTQKKKCIFKFNFEKQWGDGGEEKGGSDGGFASYIACELICDDYGFHGECYGEDICPIANGCTKKSAVGFVLQMMKK